ncbi:unnamed protein product [Moneuplotes crassus]|uniref:Uncharacterized protein n=1 Tax=Euplotes crassus TaxID=5936 RepID=A0AAD1U787_EUPCR|nr:unnamed protein product [Moneuplotes crassus]
MSKRSAEPLEKRDKGEIEVRPEINDWKIDKIKRSLRTLLMNMKCSEPDCPKPAEKMYKIDNQNKDLRCKDHVYSLTKDKSNYRDLEFFWTDIQNTLDNTKREVMKCQVLLCIVDCEEFQKMLGLERLGKLEKIKEKLNRNLTEFEGMIRKTKAHFDFDIFAFLQQQISAIDKDIQFAYNIIGPFLAETYSSKLLEKVQRLEEEDIALSEQTRRATSLNTFEEEKQSTPRPRKSNTNMFSSFKKKITMLSHSSAKPEIPKEVDYSKLDKMPTVQMTKTNSNNMKRIQRRKHDEDFEIPCLGESVTTTIRVPMITPTSDPKNPIIEPVNYKILTVLAALKEDFSNQTEKAQLHIDFLYKLRDRYPSVRNEVDSFINENKLKPSDRYSKSRVIANTPEIKELLCKYSIDKNAKIDTNYVLDLNLANSRKLSKFFQCCAEYQMPKIKRLNIVNVNKVDEKLLENLHRFLSHTMASHILELYFGASKQCDVKQFNSSIGPVMRRGYSEHSSIYFYRLNFDNEDLRNVFDNIPEIRKICFDECCLSSVGEAFTVNRKKFYSLEKLSLKVSDKRMGYLPYIAKAMSKTMIRKTLKEVEINNPVTNPDRVKEMFNRLGFKIDKVKNLKFEDVFIL